MVFLSAWLRRSGVMTGAEWIEFRFGTGTGARLAHMVVVAFALLNVIGFLAYGFIGIGKFAAAFLPWQLSADPAVNVQLWGLVIVGITTLYVVKGEHDERRLHRGAPVRNGVGGQHRRRRASRMQTVSPEMLARFVPAGWHTPWFGARLDLDWSRLMPAVNDRIGSDGWSFFSAFFAMMLLKGLLQAGAGPAPNYDMQRTLSTRSPREAAKMNGIVNVVLLVPRYMLVTGLTVLALAFYSPALNAMGTGVDFDLILPFALRNFIPTGLLGLLIAALLAAFMANFAATVNAAPAYIVNDIYKRYVNPGASERTLVRMSYAASLAVVIVGTGMGLFVASLNDMVQWIVSALYGGYTAANLLKWYWWRFNAYGFFWGMITGIIGAMIVPLAMQGVAPIYGFPVILALSLAGAIAGTLMTPPDDRAVLERFYLRVRPWGFWKPVHDGLLRRYPALEANTNFRRDLFNVVVGIVWQTSLTATGICIVLRDVRALAVTIPLIVVTMAILKRSWYDRLEDYPADLPASDRPLPAAA